MMEMSHAHGKQARHKRHKTPSVVTTNSNAAGDSSHFNPFKQSLDSSRLTQINENQAAQESYRIPPQVYEGFGDARAS
jgi:hypothetical protein